MCLCAWAALAHKASSNADEESGEPVLTANVADATWLTAIVRHKMGAHHFKFHLVPAGAHISRTADGELAGDFLVGHKISEEVASRLRALLPKPNHWGTVEEFNSASEWGSDIRIYREEDGSIGDIAMRFSPGADSLDVLRSFVGTAKEARCDVLVDSSTEVIPAEFEAVFSALKKHRAFRFLSDPISAIKEAAKEANQAPEPMPLKRHGSP
jgi:hypothetical protein